MISEPEWESIRALCEKISANVSGTRKDYFITGKVVKVDSKNRCIFLSEFGDQPIPIVAFDYEVSYYDETPKGTVGVAVGAASQSKISKKKATTVVVMPKVGQTVLVARELGTRRLPRALGVILGKNWIVPEDE
jgi:hypothetical protein